ADQDDLEQNIRLPSAVEVAGRVLDEKTGKGIPGVSVYYQRLPAGPRHNEPNMPMMPLAVSGLDGRFRIALPPGKGRLDVSGWIPRYFAPVSQEDNAPHAR